MQNQLLLLLNALTIAIGSFAQDHPGGFMLKGKLSGQQDGIIYLSYPGNKNNKIKDSSLIRNGFFSFKGEISEPVMAFLTLKEAAFNERHSTGFYLEPSDLQIKLQATDFSTIKVKGSVTQDEIVMLTRSKKKLLRKYKKQLDSLNREKDAEKRTAIEERLAPYYLENEKRNLAFYAAHRDSYLPAYSLQFYIVKMSLDSLQMFYNAMAPKVQQSRNGIILKSEIELRAQGSPGSKASGFTKVDIKGNKLSLSDMKGKYVLMDFWASWCVPCRKQNPHLITLYNRYKEKGIEFIGVADDDHNPDAWIKAVEKDNLPWRHVLRGLDVQKRRNEERNENDINENYGVHTLPTKILVDRNGIIIGRFENDEDGLDLLLQKIFGE